MHTSRGAVYPAPGAVCPVSTVKRQNENNDKYPALYGIPVNFSGTPLYLAGKFVHAEHFTDDTYKYTSQHKQQEIEARRAVSRIVNSLRSSFRSITGLCQSSYTV